jgi:hypothetical protein
MEFFIYEGEKIEVTSSGKIFLIGEVQKGLRYNLKFYKNGELLFETRFPIIRLYGKVPKIIQHNLKYPIEEFGKKGLFGFYLKFNGNSSYIKMQPFRKAYFVFYLNEIKIGEIYNAWKITLGYSECKMITDTDNEEINLYLLITYILFALPR